MAVGSSSWACIALRKWIEWKWPGCDPLVEYYRDQQSFLTRVRIRVLCRPSGEYVTIDFVLEDDVKPEDLQLPDETKATLALLLG